jgi:cytochrome c biogenesis protein CcdA
MAIPFFLSALGINVFLAYSPKITKHMRVIMVINGFLLIIFGIMLLTDQIRVLGGILPDFGITF